MFNGYSIILATSLSTFQMLETWVSSRNLMIEKQSPRQELWGDNSSSSVMIILPDVIDTSNKHFNFYVHSQFVDFFF